MSTVTPARSVPSIPTGGNTSVAPILSTANLHKTYRLERVGVPVLVGLNLDVKPGEWLAILGASGSGKSTLLHLLGGLDRPDKGNGSVHHEGRDLAAMSSRELDRYRNTSVGFVFQFYHLLPELNIIENVLVPAMVRHGRFGFLRRRAELRASAAELLEAFGLSARLKHRPAELSGGERQRVAIARALINDPPILLADEPTGNLDHKTGAAILDQIAAHRRKTGRTIVMVTHDREVAARADRIIRLVDGRAALSE